MAKVWRSPNRIHQNTPKRKCSVVSIEFVQLYNIQTAVPKFVFRQVTEFNPKSSEKDHQPWWFCT